MTTRIAHLSDLHLPARDTSQTAVLLARLVEIAPQLVVISGDLTRAGHRSEFEAAAQFVGALPGARVVVPGNHDIPLLNAHARVMAPFARFDRAMGGISGRAYESADVLVVGLNTAVGLRLGLDWSIGHAVQGRIDEACQALRSKKRGRVAVVVGHHPLLRLAVDPRRSRTRQGVSGFGLLAAAGMDVLLHGHLHRQLVEVVPVDGRPVYHVGANTALSDRERGGPSGFNVFDIGETMTVTAVTWDGAEYCDAPPTFLPRTGTSIEAHAPS